MLLMTVACCLLRRLWWLFCALPCPFYHTPVASWCRLSLSLSFSLWQSHVASPTTTTCFGLTLMNSINTFWLRVKAKTAEAKGMQQWFILPQLFAVAAEVIVSTKCDSVAILLTSKRIFWSDYRNTLSVPLKVCYINWSSKDRYVFKLRWKVCYTN